MHLTRASFCASLFIIGCVGRSDDSEPHSVLDSGNESTRAAGANEDAEVSPPPPSCLSAGTGLSDCGSAKESCCLSPFVTGGTYYRTYPDTVNGVTANADPATVSSFRLDKYDVTVGRFRQFVNAWNTGWLPAPGSGKHAHLNGGNGLSNPGVGGFEPGWMVTDNSNLSPTNANLSSCMSCQQNMGPAFGADAAIFSTYSTWTDAASTQEDLPINCVNWQEAYAFCIWDGAFLPSEAEWEYAAAGGSEQREFPWGSADLGQSNRYAIYNCNFPVPGMFCSGPSNIAPVGSATLGIGRWGHLDLAGNLEQWTMDESFGYGPCTDCAPRPTPAAPFNLTEPVIRGGYFGDFTGFNLLPTYRDAAGSRQFNVGFRCARIP